MIFYIVGLFVIILSIVMIFYFSASENTRIKNLRYITSLWFYTWFSISILSDI